MSDIAATILLVEDNQLVREIVKETLQRAGFRVLESDTGEQALAVASQCREPINVLVCDIVLPRMSGYVLSDMIHQVHPETNILHITGHPDISDAVRRGFPERQRRFLLKPFSQGQLLATVRELIERDPAHAGD